MTDTAISKSLSIKLSEQQKTFAVASYNMYKKAGAGDQL
jgi:hypothetical protein